MLWQRLRWQFIENISVNGGPLKRMNWLIFTLIAVIASGVFGVLTQTGQRAMQDSTNGQYKVLLFAGVGYSLIAIVESLLILRFKGIEWRFPIKGMLLATLVGSCQRNEWGVPPLSV